MIDSGTDAGEIPTATLQEILDNNEHIHKNARLRSKDRNNIALYLRAFHLDAKVLDEQYGFGVYAVWAIQESSTYQGFVCAVVGIKYPSFELRSLDYRVGYEAGIKESQRQKRA